jgi:protein ImuA
MPAEAAVIEALRSLIARSAPAAAGPFCPLGIPALDAALGGGLPTGCLQEVIGLVDGAAAGFAAFLLGRLAVHGCPNHPRPVLWGWLGEGDLHPPGLAAFGLDPARVILLSAASPADLLWAMEEGLREPGLAGVLAELDGSDLVAGRRLQLAAAAGGVTGFLLARGRRLSARELAGRPSAAALRWRVDALPGGRWRVELLRRRGGSPGAWILERGILERENETDRLLVAAALADGSPAPATADPV